MMRSARQHHAVLFPRRVVSERPQVPSVGRAEFRFEVGSTIFVAGTLESAATVPPHSAATRPALGVLPAICHNLIRRASTMQNFWAPVRATRPLDERCEEHRERHCQACDTPGAVEADWQRDSSYPKVVEKLPHVSRKVAPNYASELRSCPKVSQQLPKSYPGSRDSGRCWPNFGRLWPHVAIFLPSSTKLGRQFWPVWAEVGKDLANFGKTCSKLAEFLSKFANFGRNSANLNQVWQNLAKP